MADGAPFAHNIPFFDVPGSGRSRQARPDAAHRLQADLGRLGPLCMANYTKYFQTLLWLEECQMHLDIMSFDKRNATMEPTQGNYHLELDVPGLAENRPSVLRGDKVHVVKMVDGSPSGRWYEGYAHEIRMETVLLRFSPAFHRG